MNNYTYKIHILWKGLTGMLLFAIFLAPHVHRHNIDYYTSPVLAGYEEPSEFLKSIRTIFLPEIKNCLYVL